MLELLQSNSMSALLATFSQRQSAQQSDPFQASTVVVQSFGIGQWLKHEYAKQNGIAANISCILPAKLIWTLYQAVLPKHQLLDDSPFSRSQLSWQLMKLLPEAKSDEFASIQQYLSGPGDKQLRLYQLSDTISGLFDQYLLYRPDWIQQWEDIDNKSGESHSSENSSGESNVDQAWQSSLWRQVIAQTEMDKNQHRANLHHEFIRALAASSTPPSSLPKTISVFGLSSLPAIHMQALQAISKFIDIDIYFLNPCQHYWGDIVSEKDIAKRSIRNMLKASKPLEDDDYLEVGNPLLSSMGKQGREYLELLLETTDIHTQEYFEGFDDGLILSNLKNDILQLEFGGEFFDSSQNLSHIQAFDENDTSIQIHCCHSRMREVEILYEQILSILDSKVQLSDIIVMAPNISQYAPFIEAVFQKKLRYSITDRPLSEASAISSTIEELLDLPNARLTASEVVDLLEIPAVSAKLELDDTDLARLIYWIQETGIRWEVDGAAKQSLWDLPASNHNTWSFGLERLLLGFAMQSAPGSNTIYDNISPFDVNANDSRLIAKLCDFIALLDKYRRLLSEEKAAEEWRLLVCSLIDDFFLIENNNKTQQGSSRNTSINDELAINSIRDACQKLVDQSSAAQFSQGISPALFRHWLNEQIAGQSDTRGFISGGITFATLIPMRSIPFKAVCLIGMNDKEYPREDSSPSFDLMQSNYRKGDRSKRNDDRYLFLEALLSAERYFYLSFQGRSLKDNKVKPPSVLVGEVDDYLQRVYGQSFIIEHPLQPFNQKYYDVNYPKLKSYKRSWYDALKTINDNSNDNNTKNTEPFVNKGFIDRTLGDDPDLHLDSLAQLIQLFRHPARFYLNNRLGVYLDLNEFELKDTESFALDALDTYKLSDSALQILVQGKSIPDWEAKVRADGLIIEGKIGSQVLKREILKAESIYQAVLPYIVSEATLVNESLQLSHGVIQGQVPCFDNQLIDYRTGTLRKRQLIEVWIKHLFVNALGSESESILISKHTNIKKVERSRFLPIDKSEALEQLNLLATLYQNSISKPLSFLPETSFALFESLKKVPDIEVAKEAALHTFHGARTMSEGDERHTARLFEFPRDFGDEFLNTAEIICQPIDDYWEKLK